MMAVPRWSHRDPVEEGNPFPSGDRRRARWDEATARAREALQRYDDEIAASAAVGSDPGVYARQWIALATQRFDTWAHRGLAAVDDAAAQPDYAAWLDAYVTNWRVYVADTCPHVNPEVRRELDEQLQARADHWTCEARRLAASREARECGSNPARA